MPVRAPAHAGTFLCVVPTTHNKENKHEQVQENIACHMAIRIFTAFPFLKKKPYWGNHFWAKGYCVDSVGLNSEMIQKYVRFQEKEEMHQEQLQLEPGRGPSQKGR
jgi:Transposase IS200 like